MPTEQIGDYEVEYAGVRVVGGEEWVAQVAIFGHSTNPMHRNPVFPAQRVLADQTFADEKSAEAGARQAAHELLEQQQARH
ncbi:hypothetical protein G5B88_13565 [Herbaspirillum seropedicae]|uniref:hypothetical protein n=1 Tax=Herbaspirillum seropedicae TaxID=964 RepID=UPI0002DEABEA|nr:hypothetical protein [Herbaspirillum seropedicae]AKN66130.1 hypothetical protein ACP92_13410 [Herbaspirillum seropedicae]AON55012.1 hypothetical protein Hsc_2730 [Herbaspirillum seropedicae]MDR6393934.1 hypothetical protein [Herbaspirillum seropedicae]NQE30782.1 hypothetical protein [Herbaspirillum seropedicae]QDD65073.1 hypothetical protein EJD96_13340 [Herbaspirillum seropedicae]